MNADIFAALVTVLVEAVGADPAQVSPQTRFEDLGLDSLLMIEVAVAAEDAFGVRIPDDDIEELTTVGEAVDLIARARVATP